MSNSFWQKLNKPFTVLAPMANVTDWAFRQVIIEAGRIPRNKDSENSRILVSGRPDVFYTEFISADGICAIGSEKFKGELYFEENERPIVVQFFSANPENMYRCAQLAQELGFDGIDINMGCPDRSIEKQGAGAALIKTPDLAKKIIRETIRGSGELPVSVKTRLGYNKIEHDWMKHLLDTEIAVLAIHARTRKEMSKVPAHWDEVGLIAEVSRSFGKLIVGNGDVKNLQDVYDKAKEFGLDGVMIGRGIFDNPYFFSGREGGLPEERIKLLLKHLDNFEKLWGESKRFDMIKRFFKIHINGWSGAKELRTKLMETKSINDAKNVLIALEH